MRVVVTEKGNLVVSVKKCDVIRVSVEGQKVLKAAVQGVIPYFLVSTERVVVEKIAGEVIGAHRIVKLGDDGKVCYASCNEIGDVGRILGMSLNSADVGHTVRVLTFGRCEDSSFSFDVTKPIFLGLNGQIVQELPGEAVFIQRLGRVLKSSEILIDLDEPIVIS